MQHLSSVGFGGRVMSCHLRQRVGPAERTATMPMTMARLRAAMMPTRSSGRTPASRSLRDSALLAVCRSLYVSWIISLLTTATRSGLALACS